MASASVTYADIEELAAILQQPPHSWTTERLWQAYAQVERDKVRGTGAQRTLTDIISLVRHAVQLEDELVPYQDVVQQRYEAWLARTRKPPAAPSRRSNAGGWTASPSRLG